MWKPLGECALHPCRHSGETGSPLCQPVTKQPSHFHPHKLQCWNKLFFFFLSFLLLLASVFFCRSLLGVPFPLCLTVLSFSLCHPCFLPFIPPLTPYSLPLSHIFLSCPLSNEDLVGCSSEQVQVSLLLLITSAHAVILPLPLSLSLHLSLCLTSHTLSPFAVTAHDITNSCPAAWKSV